MKKVEHDKQTSTIFFENDKEMAMFKEDLLKKGGIKYDPNSNEDKQIP